MFGAFLVAETLLTTLLQRGYNDLVALLGMISTLLIGLAIWRNNVYLRDRSILASMIEARVGPKDVSLRFYDSNSQIPAQRLQRQRGYGFLRNVQGRLSRKAARWLHAWAVMRLVLSVSFLAWLGVYLSYRGLPFEVISRLCVALSLVVALDWVWEMVQRAFDSDDMSNKASWKVWVLSKVFNVGKDAGRQ